MKRTVVVSALLLLAGSAMAVDMAGQDMSVTVDATWVSKYMWRGFDILDDSAAWQPSINFAFGNGFNANLWMSYANCSGPVEGSDFGRANLTEYDYTLSYSGTALEGDAWKTDYTVGWRYYDYIQHNSKKLDLQEGFIEACMPDLIGNGLTPHLAYYQMWSAVGDSAVGYAGGDIFLMGFNYDFTMDQAPEYPMTFSWDIVYNDGAGSGPMGPVSSDWSHMVWGLKTSIDGPCGGKITPAVYYQNSFEKSVNEHHDDLWAGLSYSYTF